MLRTLLESKGRSPRRRVAMIASVVAHITLFTGLVMARTEATAEAIGPIATRVVYFPPKQPDLQSRRTKEVHSPTTDRSRMSLPAIAPLPDRVVDIPSTMGPIAPVQFSLGRILGHDSLSPVASTRIEVWTERTVDQPVELLPNQSPPRYPAALERAGIGGDVVVQFVVDSAGRVERGSFDIQHTTHAEFARAVRERLLALRFLPARARGRVVRQLVEQQFRFEVVRR